MLSLLALIACKKPGPPSLLALTGVFGTDVGVEVRASLTDEHYERTRPEGATLEYTLFDGPPSRKKVLCTASGPLTASSWKVPEGVEYSFAARLSFREPCTLPPGDFRYGIVAVVLAGGAVVTDEKASFVPTSLGGTGRFSFPEYYERDVAARSDGEAATVKAVALKQQLIAVGNLTSEGAPALDQPCPTLSSRAVLRADQRVLAGLGSSAAELGELAFLAINDDTTRALVRDQKEPAEIDFVELVRVLTLDAPIVVDNGYRDGKSKGAGTYRPGLFVGEVWVVDVPTLKILCRAKTGATSTAPVEGKSYELGAKMQKAFADQVGSEINRAVRTLAPGLPNTWP